MPTVIAALGGAHLYPWVFSIYMLASTVVMPIFGGLSDRLGRRGPFVAAIVIFCAGSLMAGAATEHAGHGRRGAASRASARAASWRSRSSSSGTCSPARAGVRCRG